MMITLDGSYEEGGGALVRVAMALSALTGQEFKVSNIRAGREQGGLKAQHLTAIKALKEMCNAETNAVELGSTELWFKPGKVKRGIYHLDIGTAGSISLLLQALILPGMFAGGKITLHIKGGTCGKWQASVDYMEHVLFPQLQRFVEKTELKVQKRGYYPVGGGEIAVEITPRLHDTSPTFFSELQQKTAIIKMLEQGTLEQIRGVVNVSRDLAEKEVAERIKSAAELNLRRYYSVPISIRVEYAETASSGGDILLWALCSNGGKMGKANAVILGADALVERGKRAEDIGKEAAEKLYQEITGGFPVDHYLVDQLIPFMALLPGSEIRVPEVTKHAKTNIYVAEQFLPVHFVLEKNKVAVEKK